MPVPFVPEYEIRDPIHGLIRLTATELAVVDTPVMQRLRRIRQLAMADLVYPGALHTRFEHSLGVLHLADRILTRVAEIEQMTYIDREVVRLAALLHDVGHGPFSHVSEYLLEQYVDRQGAGPSVVREKIHERITGQIIRTNPQLERILGPEARDTVLRVIEGTGDRDYRHDIVSSALDADKMDYLLRDAHFAGVKYGTYDLDMIVDSFRVHRRGPESFLMIAEAGIFALNQLVLCKHHMTQQVYAHKVRTISDAMIVRGLELAIASDPALRAAYTYDGTDAFIDRYLELDDAAVTAAALTAGDRRARSIFVRLRERHLYKEVCQVPLDDRRLPDAVARWELSNMGAAGRQALEASVAEILQCEPWEVIVHRKIVKNPAYQAPGSLDPEAVFILTRAGRPQTLDQFEELPSGRLPATERLHVIGPWAPGPDLSGDQRRQARDELADRIRALVLSEAARGTA